MDEEEEVSSEPEEMVQVTFGSNQKRARKRQLAVSRCESKEDQLQTGVGGITAAAGGGGGGSGGTNLPNADSLLSCVVCGKNFVSFGRLKSHEKTHSKTRPFKCIDCGKTFTVRYSLICHTRVHTRERPYHCTICGSRFSQASSLKTHQIYKHTKEFPYICKYCGRGFISPGQKHEHISRTHLKVTNCSTNSSTGCTFGHRRVRSKVSSTGTTASAATTTRSSTDTDEGSESPSRVSPSTTAGGPIMTTAAVQTHLSLPPGPIY